MTQPRAAQINDIQAKFSQLDPATLVSSGLGLSQSTTFSGGIYTAFINDTITGVFGGCVDSSPAILLGTIQGPFGNLAGYKFYISIPQLNQFNNNQPFLITIQNTDIITIANLPQLTTSHLVNRINATLASFITLAGFPGFLVARNKAGSLQLISPVSGTDSSILLFDTPPPANPSAFPFNYQPPAAFGQFISGTTGALSSFLTPAASPFIFAVGEDPQTRGIITVTPDGEGGIVQVRQANGEPCIVRQNARVHMGAYATADSTSFLPRYIPDGPIGNPIFGKVIGIGGSTQTTTLSFYTNRTQRPTLTTSAGSPMGAPSAPLSLLGAGDTLQITIVDPLIYASPVVFSVNFASITVFSTIQNIVTLINTAWQSAATLNTSTSTQPTTGVAQTTKSTFSFPAGAPFGLSVNGSATIYITPGVGVTNSAQLVSAINGTAGIPSGTAVLSSNSDSNGLLVNIHGATGSPALTSSSVQFFPGPIAGTNPPDMRALDEMGISPGLYQGSLVAQLFGLDEIRLINPSRNPGATVAIANSAGTPITKLGFVTTSTGIGAVGQERINPGTPVQVLIPEAMTFGEVPDDHDLNVQQFLTPNRPTTLDPSLGLYNEGLPAILGPDGKLPPDVMIHIRELLDIMTLDNVTIDHNLKVGGTTTSGPIISASLTTGAISCSSIADSGPLSCTTINSTAVTCTTINTQNNPINAGTGSITCGSIVSSGTISGTDFSGTSIALTGSGTETFVASLGSGIVDAVVPHLLIPRINIPTRGATGYVLVASFPDQTTASYNMRIYEYRGSLVWSSNCFFDGTNWNKDQAGTPASAIVSNGTSTSFKIRLNSEDAPWSDTFAPGTAWREAVGFGYSGPGGTPNGALITAGFGLSGLTDNSAVPRIATAAVPSSAGGTVLTLIEEDGRIDASPLKMRTYYMTRSGVDAATDAAYVRTCNARWQSGLWNKDILGLPSFAEYLGSSSGANLGFTHPNVLQGGQTRKLKGAQNNVAWNDSAWDSTTYYDYISGPPTGAGAGTTVHVFSGQIESGVEQINTISQAQSPRFFPRTAPSSVSAGTVIEYASDSTSTVVHRRYAGPNEFGDTINAVPNGTGASITWQADNVGLPATALIQTLTKSPDSSPAIMFRTKFITSSPWTTWDSSFIFEPNGSDIRFVAGDDPSAVLLVELGNNSFSVSSPGGPTPTPNSSPFSITYSNTDNCPINLSGGNRPLNLIGAVGGAAPFVSGALYADNIVKAWITFYVNGSNSFSTNKAFNMSVLGITGGDIQFGFHNAMSTTFSYATLMTITLNPFTPNPFGALVPVLLTQTTTGFSVNLQDAITGSDITDYGPMATFAFSIVVME